MNKNIMLTAIGSFSAEYAVSSLRRITTGTIIGCDIYPASWHAVSQEMDAVLLAPLVSNTDAYKQFIAAACTDHQIDIIIPLTDIEVDFFHSNRAYFKNELGVLVTIANEKFIETARDKYALSYFVKGSGFLPYVQTYQWGDLEYADFPLIGKPKDGRSSEGLMRLDSRTDLVASRGYEGYVFQEVINGPVCTVDFVRDHFNNSVALPRKELIRTKNGAGLTVQTFQSPELEGMVKKIGEALQLIGCVNMEFIMAENGLFLIDINPRFSAGIGFSGLAGYDFVKNHIAAYFNQPIDPLDNFKSIIAQKRTVDVINQEVTDEQ